VNASEHNCCQLSEVLVGSGEMWGNLVLEGLTTKVRTIATASSRNPTQHQAPAKSVQSRVQLAKCEPRLSRVILPYYILIMVQDGKTKPLIDECQCDLMSEQCGLQSLNGGMAPPSSNAAGQGEPQIQGSLGNLRRC
jgi:hypothetical protein